MHNPFPVRLSLLVILLSATGAYAAGPDPTPLPGQISEVDELPVVLSVSRLAQPLHDAPGSVTVFDADAIRTSGARDLAELMRMVPGFLVAQSANGAPLAVYHGMTDENSRGLQVLIDGRSQYSPLFFGGVAWNLIDVSLDEVERIEVIRGSNSAAFGSNAFLGVINIVTRSSADTQGVRVRIGQGNDGIADRYARAGVQLGGAFVRMSAESQRDQGVSRFDDDRRNERLNLRADLPLGTADELQLQAGHVGLRLGIGTAGSTREPSRDETAAKDFISLGWQRTSPDGEGLSLRYTRSDEEFKDVFVATDARLDALTARLGLPRITVPVNQRIRTERDELEFQNTLVPTPTTRVVWGAGARYDAVRGEQFYGTRKAVRQEVNRLFGNLEWRPNSAWTGNLGLTWENDSLSDTSVAPRAGLNYHLSPRQTLRAGVSRAHRLPSLTEDRSMTHYGAVDTGLFGMPFGVRPVEITRHATGDLKQEAINVQEIGYLGDFRDQGVFVDVRIFREAVRDRIVPAVLPLTPPDCEFLGLLARGCGSAVNFLNAQDLTIHGLEYQLRWRPRTTTELTLNQSFIDIESHASRRLFAIDPATALAVERHMDHSAPGAATMLRWTERLPWGLEGAVTHYRYGRFQWTANSAIGAFHRTDLRVAWPFKAGSSRGELAATLQGIGGKHAEYRDRAATATDPNPPAAQFLEPRGWLTLVLAL